MKPILLGCSTSRAHGHEETLATLTHHLLQLVLDLPVDLCHLEEHISCKDKMQGAGLRHQALGDTPGLGQMAPC